MSMGPRAYATILLVLAAIAAVAFVNLSAGDNHIPANSLNDQPGMAVGAWQQTEILHQPTILRADSAASPKADQLPIRIPVRLSAEPPSYDWETHRNSTPSDLPPTEFLTIPSLEPPQRR